MTKKITISLLLAVALTLSFCGKKEEPKTEPAATTTETTTSTTTTADAGLAGQIKAYEDFVTKFCALTDKMKGASKVEKAALSAEFAKDSSNLKTLQTDLAAAKASDNEKAQIAAASKKAADCAAAANSSSSTSPSTPSLPAKPSIPGM